MNALYLYCLARPECLAVVDDLTARGVEGVDERYPVSAVVDGDLVAVVGEVDVSEYHETNLQTLTWIGPRACRHEAVVEAVMSTSPVLPVKFGTIFLSPQSLRGLLARHRGTVSRFFEELRDKAEWSVKGYLDEEKARQAIAAADQAIQARLAALPASPGARYFQQKLVDAMIAAALREWVGRQAHDLGEALRVHAVETAELRLLSSEVTGRSERMIFNGSFLVAHGALDDFRAVHSSFSVQHSAFGMICELKGPWPPYHFCPDLSVTGERIAQ
jgi:hypothetical protein